MIAFSGQWPEPRVPAGFVPTGAGESVTLHILGVEDKETTEVIGERVYDGGLARGGASSWKAPRLTMHVSTTTPPEEFARLIDFGRVYSVKGNVISVYADTLEPLPTEPVARALRGLRSKNPERQIAALGELARAQPDDRRADVLSVAEPLLDAADPRMRDHAAEAFCAWAGRDNAPRVLGLLSGDPSWPTARSKAAMLALARLKDERGIPPILARLPHLHARGDAAAALTAYGPVAEPHAIGLLKHTDPDVRSTACGVLGKVGGPRSFEPLAECLADDRTGHPAMRALWGLGPAAEDEVLKMLRHSDRDTRARACETLAKIGTRKSIPFLEPLAAEMDFSVRTHAADAITEIRRRP
jgi:hypothetical protein